MLTGCYGMSVGQLLDKACIASSSKEAICDRVRKLTFRDLDTEANEIACGLSELGVQQGDRVAVCLPPWYEFIVIVFAIAKLGAILVPFNTRYHEGEVEHILRDSGAIAVFFPREFSKVNHFEQLKSIKVRLDSLKYLIPVRFEDKEMKNYEGLRAFGVGREICEAKVSVEEDVFAIIYTSGTTGKPKGAMLTHHNLVDNAVAFLLSVSATRDDVFLHTSPYFHISGLAYILRLVACEAKAVLLESYSAERTLQLIEEEKITIHTGVPTFYILELNHPAFESYDLSSLRVATMAGAPCPVEIIRRVKSEMGCPVLISYGLTETSPVLTITDFEDDDLILSETVGRAIEGVELKIVNDLRQEVAPGEVGELVCRSNGLMKGYYNVPDSIPQVVDDERWFYTGDLSTMDEEGYVRIVGRNRDMIIRGGFNVYPNEIEDVLYAYQSVMEVAIVGLPDSVLGEVSCAAVVVRQGYTATVEELRSFIGKKVADYKVPDHIVLVEELPKTASGKVQKFLLKDLIVSKELVALR